MSAVTCVSENTKTRSKNSSIGVTRASSETVCSRGCRSWGSVSWGIAF